jgi:hypothetical protein
LHRAERSLLLQVRDNPPYNAPWSFFDLAQIRLFLGDRDGFLQYLQEGVLHCTADFMPRTFRENLELLPGGMGAEGIEILRQAEAQLT